MPSIEDWVNNPLGIIQTLFEKNNNFDSSKVKEYFGEKVKTKNALSWIPSLNDTPLHMVRANSLVRYRCMVQDMFDPEFYLGAYEVKDTRTGETRLQSGKYKDVAECGVNQSINLESSNNVTLDRLKLYCVPVPGEAEWVKKCHADLSRTKTRGFPSTSRPPVRCKRGLEDDGQQGGAGEGIGEAMEEGSGERADRCSVEAGATGAAEREPKRQLTERQEASMSQGPDLNFPLPGEMGPACIVKVYDDINSYKVNDVVEFIGVLSVDPSLARFQQNSSAEEGDAMTGVEEDEEELRAHAPPPSLVPRLHAVIAHPVASTNPYVPGDDADKNTVQERIQGEIDSLRSQLLAVLQHALLGDKLAAEYFLCHLLSTVYGRADVIPLGKFSLNVSNCPRFTVYADLIHHLVSNMTPQSHLLHMSLENMNSLKFAPKKDYTANRLCSGILQLASQTNLVVDEMALQPGQLDVNGVNNMRSLAGLISWQKVEYDFQFHKQDFPSDVAALILSEGKSILPSDCRVPLVPQVKPEDLREHFAGLDSQLTEEFLVKCRTYIGLARVGKYTLSNDLQKVIQDDFVNLRKDDPKNLTVDDFQSLLCLTRLLSLSRLQLSPGLEMWNQAKLMEQQRKARISTATPATAETQT